MCNVRACLCVVPSYPKSHRHPWSDCGARRRVNHFTCRACRGMVRHRCRLLEGAAILEIGSNPSRPEAVVAELGLHQCSRPYAEPEDWSSGEPRWQLSDASALGLAKERTQRPTDLLDISAWVNGGAICSAMRTALSATAIRDNHNTAENWRASWPRAALQP